MLLKPSQSLLCHLLKRARLFKEVCGPRNDAKLLRAAEQPVGSLIHLDDGLVVSTDNQESRRGDRREIGFGQIRSAAP